MKRFTVLLLFVMVATLTAFGRKPALADPIDSTGIGVQRACSTALDLNYLHPRKVKTHREAFDLGYCLGLIKGVYENLNGEVDFCPTDGVSIRKVTELTVSFVQTHPELKDKDSADIVRWALTDGFPCHPADAKSDTPTSTEKH
jgi:Rap1a immunity proteins